LLSSPVSYLSIHLFDLSICFLSH